MNDYHRYHFPVSGRIVELRKIPAVNGAGGITVWHPEKNRYVLIDAIPGWQMIETRDCVIIDTEEYGLVAVLPIGMSQICSCVHVADVDCNILTYVSTNLKSVID